MSEDDYLPAEARARKEIDRQLVACGWLVQNRADMNLYAGQGVAVREFIMAAGHGRADYLLFVDGKAVGAIEAKPSGTPLAGVEPQSGKYAAGLPKELTALVSPLPFLYESTGDETMFTDGFDPEPRSRPVMTFHRPETFARWLRNWIDDVDGGSLRARLDRLGPVGPEGLRRIQVDAINRIEGSMVHNHPRALAQMATGSGKTFMAANLAYRLVQTAGAERVLFLVDRANLGRQTLREFQQFATPVDGRKFTDLYNVQWLTSNRIDPAARVVITTVQRLFSMLRSEEEMPEDVDEKSGAEIEPDQPVEVVYNPQIPIETFDVVIIDECHRSIYGVWRQVIEYFDAFLVGLTATPAKQTFGFFNQNLVVEYGHAEAVADGVNVDFDVYRIRTKISEQGSTVEAGLVTKFRERETRKVRLEKLDEDVVYDARQLDRDVVALDQIRTVIRTFRDNLFKPLDEGGIFPGRTEVPKTLIFAKDDSHADDIVRICREEFGRGNDFAVKITYRTTGAKPEDLLNQFRNSFNPRIAVTVDMIATGTDVRPLECVMFMRQVRSRNFFEQMKGRGVRVIDPNDLQAVSADATAKTHFVIVDAVGVTEGEFNDTTPLERRKTESLKKLLDQVAAGVRDPDVVSSIAGRLARLERVITPDDRQELADATDGIDLSVVVRMLTDAVDTDRAWQKAAENTGGVDPTVEQVHEARAEQIETACRILAERPALRTKLLDVRRSYTQVLDETSKDEVIDAGFSRDASDRARATIESWQAFVDEHRDDIDALQILYSRPYGKRLTLKAIKELAATIGRPPYNWTPERLWAAYEALEASRVRGSAGTQFTNLISLVRKALEPDGDLVAYPLTVDERFQGWLAQQAQAGTVFTDEQLVWLTRIKDHLATSLAIAPDDFELEPFVGHGGFGRANNAFDGRLAPLLDELAQELVA
ncbi:MAG: DEAD/DEAH box helicase family protein [Acidimicrobiales bacterium]|jgi:type I restriction enzyme R subunit|nr:DEAD/DEAH box helicase family protein [Acidimicrobiales bacterium]